MNGSFKKQIVKSTTATKQFEFIIELLLQDIIMKPATATAKRQQN